MKVRYASYWVVKSTLKQYNFFSFSINICMSPPLCDRGIEFRNKTVVTTLFRYAWIYWLDFWHVSIYWWVTEEVDVSFRYNDIWPSYGPWTLQFGQLVSYHQFFFAMFGDIDLMFGIWVYNDELQIKITFRSCPMILGRAMVLGLWNVANILEPT